MSDYADIDKLCEIAPQGVAGAIVGRALYDGAIDLAQAQSRADKLIAGG